MFNYRQCKSFKTDTLNKMDKYAQKIKKREEDEEEEEIKIVTDPDQWPPMRWSQQKKLKEQQQQEEEEAQEQENQDCLVSISNVPQSATREQLEDWCRSCGKLSSLLINPSKHEPSKNHCMAFFKNGDSAGLASQLNSMLSFHPEFMDARCYPKVLLRKPKQKAKVYQEEEKKPKEEEEEDKKTPEEVEIKKTPEEVEIKKEPEEVKLRNQNCLVAISNVPKSATREQLEDWCRSCGNLQSLLIHPSKLQSDSKNYCMAFFKDGDSAVIAKHLNSTLSAHPECMNAHCDPKVLFKTRKPNQRVKMEHGDTKEEEEKKPKEEEVEVEVKKTPEEVEIKKDPEETSTLTLKNQESLVVISNMPKKVPRSKLENWCKSCGILTSLLIRPDKLQPTAKNYCLAFYKSGDSAAIAKHLNSVLSAHPECMNAHCNPKPRKLPPQVSPDNI